MRTETYCDAPALSAALRDIRRDISHVPLTTSRTTYYHSRWYDYGSARWPSTAQIGMPVEMNQPAFCRNDPINNTDPLGLLTWQDAFGLTVGTFEGLLESAAQTSPLVMGFNAAKGAAADVQKVAGWIEEGRIDWGREGSEAAQKATHALKYGVPFVNVWNTVSDATENTYGIHYAHEEVPLRTSIGAGKRWAEASIATASSGLILYGGFSYAASRLTDTPRSPPLSADAPAVATERSITLAEVPEHARRTTQYDSFIVLSEKGRVRYYTTLRRAESPDRLGARLVTEVDADTGKALRIWQEAYDLEGRVIEVHPKRPIDLGHISIDPATGQEIGRRP